MSHHQINEFSSKRIRFTKSLNAKILFFALMISLVPLAIVGVFAYISSHSALQTSLYQGFSQSAQIQTDSLTSWLQERINNVSYLAGTEEIKTMNAETMASTVDNALAQYPVFDSLYVMLPDGMEVYDTDTDINDKAGLVNLSEREYFKKAISGETYLSEPVVSKNIWQCYSGGFCAHKIIHRENRWCCCRSNDYQGIGGNTEKSTDGYNR